MFYKCAICIIYAMLMASLGSGIGIPDQQEFGPILRPENPTGARNILGYDNFQTSNNAKQEIKYGNHWEQFDTEPVQNLRFNAGGGGSHYNQHPLFNSPQGSSSVNYQHNPQRVNQQRY